jgi:large repetitive protein
LNDEWQVYALSVYNAVNDPIKDLRVRIFNRWGQLLYESRDIYDGWDGTYHGVQQPSGVYMYLLEAEGINGKIIQQKGNITLLR